MQAVRGPTRASGGAMSASPVESRAKPRLPAIFSYIQIKTELILSHRCISIWLQMGKLGQIRDTKPKMGQMGVPGEL